jgi:hypothetical protein
MVGFANITARAMLDHLFMTYGNITTVDLENNFEHMRRAWDPQQPVESLFKQIQLRRLFLIAQSHVQPYKICPITGCQKRPSHNLAGLTEQAINKHLKLTPATTMGHMNHRRHNIRSNSKTPITSDIEDVTVTPAGLGTKTHLVYAVLVEQGQLYTDLTGKFPVRSSKGNWYVMVCYVFDWNYIKVVPMKSRSASEWVKAYDLIHQELTSKGFKPKIQTLDNEASSALNFFHNSRCGIPTCSTPLSSTQRR